MAGWGPALMAGSTFALPSSGRFSASGFLPDVRATGATYFNYVGKPLSFILATPEQPDDADNPLVRAFGNEGTTDDVARFAERFGVAVTDSYGSTEGGATVQRTPDTPPGALGRAPEGTVVLDPATGAECPPARFDEQGRLLNAEEAIGELVSKAGGAGFEGYWRNSEAETARLARAGTGRATWPTATTPASSTSPDGTTTGCASTGRTSPRLRSSAFCSATPTSCWPRSTPCPTPSSATRSWPRCNCGPGSTRSTREELLAFLAAQGDLGTKWAPRFVRMSAELPATATNKVLKRSLRAERWNCDDPVLWQAEKGGAYRLLTDAEAATLEAAVGDRAI